MISHNELDYVWLLITPFMLNDNSRIIITIPPSTHVDCGDLPDVAHGRNDGRSHRNGGVLVANGC